MCDVMLQDISTIVNNSTNLKAHKDVLRRIFLYNRNWVNLTSTCWPTLEIRFRCFGTIKPNFSSKFVNFSRGRPVNSLCLTVWDNIPKFSGGYTILINTSSF